MTWKLAWNPAPDIDSRANIVLSRVTHSAIHAQTAESPTHNMLTAHSADSRVIDSETYADGRVIVRMRVVSTPTGQDGRRHGPWFSARAVVPPSGPGPGAVRSAMVRAGSAMVNDEVRTEK